MVDEELEQLLKGTENVVVDAFIDDVLNSQEDLSTSIEPTNDKESLEVKKDADMVIINDGEEEESAGDEFELRMREKGKGPVTTERKAQKKNDVKARNLDTMSIDDLYNDFKIVEQEVKRTVTSSSNSNSSSQNMALVSSPNSTNEVNTVNVQVSTTNSLVSTVDTLDSTANLSDATVYAFLANQPNGSQLVHEDLEQIHEDDLEEKMKMKVH
ncbi:hypothetical protein Tco_1420779 [Tanacetum coccineum]